VGQRAGGHPAFLSTCLLPLFVLMRAGFWITTLRGYSSFVYVYQCRKCPRRLEFADMQQPPPVCSSPQHVGSRMGRIAPTPAFLYRCDVCGFLMGYEQQPAMPPSCWRDPDAVVRLMNG
jgi:hypothetical protein